uniref:Peptidase M12B domain-containing protein n=1 Tax=Ditylenchus dipsaci TaxID=166011 RepID=A0A915DWN5_9BILA
MFLSVESKVDENTTSSSRSRRSANSWDNFVEVLVVADNKMLLYHQNNLENYVLTLFSTVASIYRHPTLGASINIIVVRLIILKHEMAGPRISHRAQETLQQFCNWQQNYNDGNDDAINHHDVAILLTRHDICRATNKCDTLGLAELGTMCDAQKSCAIIEDNGLSAAFTIAHELGHIFNIPHDDERKCSEFMPLNKNNYHIMAPTLEYNTNPWSWSPCSAHMLNKFLDSSRAQTQCILDQPIERRYFEKMYENPAPGSTYSVNQQCQFVFGSSAEFVHICRLVVVYGALFPMAIKWVVALNTCHGQMEHRVETVGGVTEGNVLECHPLKGQNKTEIGGKALRDCDNPGPSNGGKYCVGQRERYRPCNIQECPYDMPGFREMQCSEFDGRDVGIHGVPKETKWVPKYAGVSENERCHLYCRSSNSAAFYLLKDKVLDGTPCDRNSDDICINGICHKAGCDHRLDSEMKRDVCGICGGDGKSCSTVQGVYNERGSFGYNEVLKIPAGSANIDIRQSAYNNQKDDDNYLALRSGNGEFILNGHYQVLEYSGSDHIVERINGSGPLKSDIYLHILSVGNLNLPNIQYKYMVAKPSVNNAPLHHAASFYWRFSESWSDCSSKCQGSQTQQLVCFDAVINRQVNERHCEPFRKPDIKQRMCNVDCFYKWQHTASNDVRDRKGHFLCVRMYTSGREEMAREEECLTAGLARPEHKQQEGPPCRGNCDRRWAYSEWNACSESCGTGGVSRRSIQCVDNSNRKLDNRFCDGISREPTETECNRIPCPKWNFGVWSECSRSCGGGIRVRHAQCQDASGKDLSPQQCPPSEKLDREKCNEHLCTLWKFGAWSTCSVTCGGGVERRDARCVDQHDRVLEDSRCNVHERIIEKQCNQPSCPQWKLGSWSSCSVSCMDGFMTRSVTCVDASDYKLPDARCLKKGELKPASHQTCSYGSCPYWKAAEWSDCSVSCGAGIKEREVDCIYREQSVDDSLCPDRQRPVRQEQCALLACAEWKPETWGACSVSCGSGVQKRAVHCTRTSSNKKTIVIHDAECNGHKPRDEKICERDPCPPPPKSTPASQKEASFHWATAPWAECSATCGKGTQRRLVQCHDHVRQLPSQYCGHLKAEKDVQDCQLRPCYDWTIGPWGECSESCGKKAMQQRKVACEAIATENSSLNPEEVPDCDTAKKPEESKKCDLPDCPKIEPKSKIGKWESGDWSECSSTCGGGWRRRSVFCSQTLCNETQKPTQFEQCNTEACKIASWKMGPWTHCSVSCDEGVQSRSVWCQSDINILQKLEVTACDIADRPISLRNCTRAACPLTSTASTALKTPKLEASNQVDTNSVVDSYNWLPGAWSSCSQTCGRGVRQRSVKCVDLSNQEVSESKCNASQRPVQEHKCRQANCPRWHKSKWSSCSTTCGAGVNKREVYCKQGRNLRIPDDKCFNIAKPYETKKCEVAQCARYMWKVTPWSKCIDPCKPTEQTRRVYCMSNFNKRAASRMCNSTVTP